jgi:hypothetical protein
MPRRRAWQRSRVSRLLIMEQTNVLLTEPDLAAPRKLVFDALRDHAISKATAPVLRANLTRLDHAKCP